LIKIVKNPGNARLNNLNNPVLNVLRRMPLRTRGGCAVSESGSVRMIHYTKDKVKSKFHP